MTARHAVRGPGGKFIPRADNGNGASRAEQAAMHLRAEVARAAVSAGEIEPWEALLLVVSAGPALLAASLAAARGDT